jgi:hypothetical protein
MQMKKAKVIPKFAYGLLFLALMFYCICPNRSYADPPQYLYLEYDIFFKTLSVTITHESAATDRHYIKNVILRKNGDVISTNAYTSQPDPSQFTYTYDADAADGDVLEVTAECSTSGSLTTSFNVRE